jgi:hypothetical protein
LGALELPDLNIAGMAQYDPEQVDAEVQFAPDRWRLVLGLRYRRWSEFPGFLGQTFVCPPGEPVCGTEAPADPDFSDTWTPKAALALRFSLGERASAELRSGVAYEPTRCPNRLGRPIAGTNARVVASAGYGVDFDWSGVPLSLEIAFQQHWMRERTHVKSSDMAAGDPNLSSSRDPRADPPVALAAGVRVLMRSRARRVRPVPAAWRCPRRFGISPGDARRLARLRARSKSMAGATAADARDYSVNYYNPLS